MHRKIFNIIAAIFQTLWLPISLVVGIGFIRVFLWNISYVIFQQLIDRLTTARLFSDLHPLLFGYVSVNLLNHILIYAEGYPGTKLHRGIVQWVKLHALEKMARIDYLAYQSLGTGNLIQVIENGAEAVRKILTGFYMSNLNGIAIILVSLYFIQSYNSTLFLVVLVLFVLFYLTANYLMRFLKKALDKMLASQEDFSKFSVRAFMELVVFRINGRFKAEYERLGGISDEMVRAQAKVYLLQELAYTGMAVLVFFVEVGVVIQQAGKIIAGTSTVGTLMALVLFIRQVFWPVIGIGHALLNYKMDALTYSHLDQVLALPDDPGLAGGRRLDVPSGRIRFDHVTFAYAEQEVLNGFDLEIEPGKTTAFVGASGGGKSTLLRLLLHLIKPQQGKVLVDGQDLSQVHLTTYYEQVAYVPQEPPIFDGTLRENLTFNHPVGPGRLSEVLCLVGLEGLVGKLPNGLDTLVGERGIKLSGGERQRLAFGRIMLQEPKIIILDEATASLDSLTEAWVTRNLMAFLQGKTIIIVAHRLQTVRDADQIIVLDEGRIVQKGKFAELLSAPGPFRLLWEKQSQENPT